MKTETVIRPREHQSVRRAGGWCVAAIVCAATLVACGSDDSDDRPQLGDLESLQQSIEAEVDAAREAEVPDTEATGAEDAGVKPIELLLPDTSAAPAGFHTVPAICDTEADGSNFRAWYTFAVPAEWTPTGRIGGSTSPHNEGTSLDFSPNGVRVALEGDTVLDDGSIGDRQGEAWTSFDYDYTVGDETTTVRYEELGTVAIGEQEVAIMTAPHAQAPDILNATEYKARIHAANLYGTFTDGSAYPVSFVVTITASSDEKELPTEVVEGIVASIAMPECASRHTIVEREASLNIDVDGDGEIATPADYADLLSSY